MFTLELDTQLLADGLARLVKRARPAVDEKPHYFHWRQQVALKAISRFESLPWRPDTWSIAQSSIAPAHFDAHPSKLVVFVPEESRCDVIDAVIRIITEYRGLMVPAPV